jgi:hypothetical protein
VWGNLKKENPRGKGRWGAMQGQSHRFAPLQVGPLKTSDPTL